MPAAATVSAARNVVLTVDSSEFAKLGTSSTELFASQQLLQQYVYACSYFCNTTNLSKGESSVHEQGPLWRLVRASMTIVGMVPPVYYKGDLLVDGGYMNNIPVDVMRSMGVDTVSPCSYRPAIPSHCNSHARVQCMPVQYLYMQHLWCRLLHVLVLASRL